MPVLVSCDFFPIVVSRGSIPLPASYIFGIYVAISSIYWLFSTESSCDCVSSSSKSAPSSSSQSPDPSSTSLYTPIFPSSISTLLYSCSLMSLSSILSSYVTIIPSFSYMATYSASHYPRISSSSSEFSGT